MHQPLSKPTQHNDYQKFRPRYPLDPFQDSESRSKHTFDRQQSQKEPWRLDVDKLPPVELTKLCRTVLLVLGEPPSQQLIPLLKSQHFFSSLIIIVTASPVYLPAGVFPTVRILKLNEPIEVENQGAERLVRTLEWAERVARVWRIKGGEGVSELQESVELSQSAEFKLHKRERPGSSTSRLPPSSSAPNILRMTGRPPSMTSMPRSQTMMPQSPRTRKGSSSFLPPPDPAQRAFDVLVNFLPATGIPDGYLLKNAILVTTISRPFVVATSVEDPSKKMARTKSFMDKKRGSKWTVFRRSAQKDFNVPIPPIGDSTSSLGHGGRSITASNSKLVPSIASSIYPPSAFGSSTALHQTFTNSNPALIIHILPSPPPHPHNYVYTQKQMAARDKLIESIDSFLCAFGASQASFSPKMAKAPLDLKGSVRGDDKRAFSMGAIPRARPYVVDGNSFANDVFNASGDSEGEWSLAELICCGCLDPNPSPASPSEGKGEHRVWISGISDIIISSASQSGSVGDTTSRSLTPEDDSLRHALRQLPLPPITQSEPSQPDNLASWSPPIPPSSYPQPAVHQLPPLSRPIPTHYQQQHSTFSSLVERRNPPISQTHPQPMHSAKFTQNNDSISSADTHSSHGFSGTPSSSVPPPLPEKDFAGREPVVYGNIQQQVHQQQQLQSQKVYEMYCQRVSQPQDGYQNNQTGYMQVGSLPNEPSQQTMLNGPSQSSRPGYRSNEQNPSQQMNTLIPTGRLSKSGPPPDRVRRPPHNHNIRPMSYHSTFTSSPSDTKKKSPAKWKFWR